MDSIKIENLQIFAYHGVFAEENTLGQKFTVTAELFLNTRQAGISDDLKQSVNYAAVCMDIVHFMTENTYKLIESAAEQLAEYLLSKYEILEKVILEVKKPWAPIGLPVDNVSVKIERGWHTAYIALGSNIGDRQAYLDNAVTSLGQRPDIKIKKVSDYIITEPYGMTQQDKFLNGCMCISTLLTPHELLDVLHEQEQNAGRERTVHWGPRTLDLDILFYDNITMSDERLIIPHPEIALRRFVLQPMVQLSPYFIHPVTHKTMLDMLKCL